VVTSLAVTTSPRVRRRERARARLLLAASCSLTDHALLRADELGFSMEEVLRCALRPEQTYSSTVGPPGRRVHQRGACAVVMETSSATIVTVLLRTQDVWFHGAHTRNHLPPQLDSPPAR
jgi:hypothetical protein